MAKRAPRRFSGRLRSLALIFVAISVGCSSQLQPPHELHIARFGDPPSLNPLLGLAQDDIALDLLWCETLVGLDRANRLIPILVTRIPSRANGDVSEDGRTLTYHLRRNVRFADGVPFTSADVAFTYRAILNPVNSVPDLSEYQQIAALVTPDPHTVVMRLRSRWPAAVRVLFAQASYAYGILPKHAFVGTRVVRTAWEQEPFGTGPFRVSSWRRGEQIVLTRNLFYAPRPKLDRIVFSILPDQSTAVTALQTHVVDISALDPTSVQSVASNREIRVVETPENGQEILYFSVDRGAARDPRVRHAIADALNFRQLSKAWYEIYPLSGSVYPHIQVYWHMHPIPAYANDPQEAGRELEAAGWHLRGAIRERDGMPLTLTIVVSAAVPEDQRIALLVAEQLRMIGADVPLRSYAAAEISAIDGPIRSGRFDLEPSYGTGGSDPETSLDFNPPSYGSARFDTLLAKLHVTVDEAERETLFDTLAQMVHDDAPFIPLHDLVYIEGVNVRVIGYARNMLRFAVHPENWDTR